MFFINMHATPPRVWNTFKNKGFFILLTTKNIRKPKVFWFKFLARRHENHLKNNGFSTSRRAKKPRKTKGFWRWERPYGPAMDPNRRLQLLHTKIKVCFVKGFKGALLWTAVTAVAPIIYKPLGDWPLRRAIFWFWDLIALVANYE